MQRKLFYPFERIVEVQTLKHLSLDYHAWVITGNSIGCKEKVCNYTGFCKDCDRRLVNMTTV